jgi:pimeloyl-ACP methyl ester carboxylesterase
MKPRKNINSGTPGRMKKISKALAITTLIAFLFASCSREKTGPRESKTYVLVHGAWQSSWVWDQVKADLENAGQKVVVVSLPAHGNDPTSPADVTLSTYRDVVISAINSTNSHNENSSNKKVILVGHSLAGMIISEVAEQIPQQIEKLVYIGAYLPADQQSLLDLANTDSESQLGGALIFNPATLGVPLNRVADIFCQDGSPEVKQLLVDRYKDEPVIPFTNKASLTAGNFGATNKYYIQTLQDHVVGPSLQNRMINAANIPNEKVYALNSSHSPFLSMPEDVAKLLLQIEFK